MATRPPTLPWGPLIQVLRLAGLLNVLLFVGCSTTKSEEAWLDAYVRHANLVKATATGQQTVLDVEGTASCIIPGVVLWPYLNEPWITQVNPVILGSDVRPGDRILAVNGKHVRHLGVLLLRLSRLRRGAPLELTLARNHEIRRVQIPCGDGTALLKTTAEILTAAAQGHWQECLRLATNLAAIAQLRYSWAAELQFNCNEAERLLARRPPNRSDASLAHQWARLRIQEAKEVPGGIEQIRWHVTDMTRWLERHGFHHLATDLSDHLDAYSPHLW